MEKCTQELTCEVLHRKLKGTQIWLNLTAGKTGGREKKNPSNMAGCPVRGKEAASGEFPMAGTLRNRNA